MIEHLESKLIKESEISKLTLSLKGKSIVFTNGCFDILHSGHVQYLARAKSLGDFLWLGLNSDESVRKLKGQGRPINSQADRAFVLAGLASIDAVTIFNEDTPLALIEKIKPQIHCKGGDYLAKNLPETPLVESFGGKVIILPFLEGKSTTLILKKAKQN